MAHLGKAVLPAFTVSAAAALPADVCLPESRRPSERPGMRGRNVMRAAGTVGFHAGTRLVDVVAMRSAASAGRSSALQPSKYLDGFAMLEASGAELPEGFELAGVVLQDLAFFRNLIILNLGDNKLGANGVCDILNKLGSALPNLVDLRLHCNGLTGILPLSRVGFYGAPEALPDEPLFPNLEILDLSYNALNAESIACLAGLPRLRELDLTANGLTRLCDWVRALVLCENHQWRLGMWRDVAEWLCATGSAGSAAQPAQ
jgi:hypothetical protein